MDVSRFQEPVLTLDVSETTGAWAAPGCVWRTGSCAGLDISTPQVSELRLDVSGEKSLWRSGHVYTRGVLAAPGRVYTSVAIVAPGRVYTTGAWVAPVRVFTKEAFAAPGRCLYSRSLEICPLEIITEFREIFSNYATRNSANFLGILGNSVRNTEVTKVQKTNGIPCCHDSYPNDMLHLSFKIICLLLLLLSFLWIETTTWTVLKNAFF